MGGPCRLRCKLPTASGVRHLLAPLVVPQLKTITLGGAVTGLGIESTSFRNGLPHESVLEMDILTGTGEVLTAVADEQSDLFRAFPNSYGTLGYSVRLKNRAGARQAVRRATHLRFHTLGDLVAAMDRIIETGGIDGIPVDYLDGVVFSATESYLTVGVQTGTPGPVSDYTGQQIYYRSIQHADGQKHDRLTISDYLWRWDTDWFWCSRAFGAQNPRCAGCGRGATGAAASTGSSSDYEQRFNIADRIEKRHGRPPRERVIQDIEVPIERTAEFLDWFLTNVPIEPIWLCPLRLRDDGRLAAVPDPPAPHLRQRRLLVIGPGRPRRGRDEPADRAQGQRTRRAQVAVLRRVLHAKTSSTNSTAARRTRP